MFRVENYRTSTLQWHISGLVRKLSHAKFQKIIFQRVLQIILASLERDVIFNDPLLF